LAVVLTVGGWALFAAALLVSLLAMVEYYGLFWPGRQGWGKKLIGAGVAVVLFLAVRQQDPLLVLSALVLAFWAGNFFFLVCYDVRPDETSYFNAAVLVSGVLYVPLALQFLIFMEPVEIIFVLLATAVTDTGAYFAGGAIGGPKIWPAISPKKTWAGSLGGGALCVLVCLGYGLWLGEAGAGDWLLAGLALTIAAQLGDFFESALKRWRKAKDSGNLLPGHGGILDRVDGLLLAAPVYAALRAIQPGFF
jgi:phosphatidate cytidylyltransferase